MAVAFDDARADDYGAFAALFPELRVPDRVPGAEEFATRIVPHAFFAREGGRIVGYVFWHHLGDTARIIHVIVAPDAQGRGVGQALMNELAERARRAGCRDWTLNVKPDNTPAIRLYERCGMALVARAASLEISWDDVARLEGDSLPGALVPPTDDEAVERDLDLLPGQLRTFRAGGGRQLIALREGERFVAFAAFDPAFPGAFPFRVRRPALARPLLEAMRSRRDAAFSYVRFVAELPELEERAVAAGAKIVLAVVQMAGKLPPQPPP